MPSRVKVLAIFLLFFFMFSIPLAFTDKDGVMLDIRTKVTVGADDAIVAVQVIKSRFPIASKFNFPLLFQKCMGDCNYTEATSYLFYLNSSGAYLLYEGQQENVPSVLYNNNTWYIKFNFGTSFPALRSFLRALGCNISLNKLESTYLSFNRSCIKPASQLPRSASAYGFTVEGLNIGNSFLINFTVSYVDPAYGDNFAIYSWRIPSELVNKELGLNFTSISVATPNLIHCDKGELPGEEYCFPTDPKGVYIYPDNLQIILLPEKSGWRYVITQMWMNGKNYTILLNITNFKQVPSYRVLWYNLQKNTTKIFPLLAFSDTVPYAKLGHNVEPFNPLVCRENVSLIHVASSTSSRKTWKAGSALMIIIALILSIILGILFRVFSRKK